VVNKLRGVFQACAVGRPATATAARRCSRTSASSPRPSGLHDLGIELQKADTSILGRAKKVIVDADYCTILGGAGDRKASRPLREIRRS
jgi:chaperonin GroEL